MTYDPNWQTGPQVEFALAESPNRETVRAFLRFYHEPTTADVTLWAAALAPLGDDLAGALARAGRAYRTCPTPADVLVLSGLGPTGGAMEDVAEAIAAASGLTLQDLRGTSRMASISRVRQHVMHELIERGFSSHRIGDLLDRDHSTVLHGAAAHRNRMAHEADRAKGGLQ